MTSYAPEDRVLASPRYLAGVGDRITAALGPLIHFFGWPTQHDPATGQVSVDSPDGSLFLDFNPSHPVGNWWSISHHEPHWTAHFSRQTPIEVIAAVTHVLPQLLGDRRLADHIPLTAMALDQIADMNHWHPADGGTLSSPDGHCLLHRAPDNEIAWRFEHSVFDGFDTHWHATFTQATPEPLVAQFFAHLSTTNPVERIFRDVPYLVQDLEDALITPVRGTSVPAHVHHACAQLDRTVRRR